MTATGRTSTVAGNSPLMMIRWRWLRIGRLRGLLADLTLQIEVPFALQTTLSGINVQNKHDTVWCRCQSQNVGKDVRTKLHFKTVLDSLVRPRVLGGGINRGGTSVRIAFWRGRLP